MSRIGKTICDCCGNELKGGVKRNESLLLTVIYGKSKARFDYCYECGKKIVDVMQDEIRKLHDQQRKIEQPNTPTAGGNKIPLKW